VPVAIFPLLNNTSDYAFSSQSSGEDWLAAVESDNKLDCTWCVFTFVSVDHCAHHLPVLSPLLAIFSTAKHPNPTSRTLAIFLGFAPCFVILSISVEGLFYVAYTTTLVLWIEVEDAVQQRPRDKARKAYRFQADDLRVALIFLFFVQVAFFGTGKYVYIWPPF
jgi:hypothetical protein